MELLTVKELMVPLEEYATVDQEASLYEAVMALEEAQTRFDPNRPRHRAVLVFDQTRTIVGKLDFLNILRGLEPKYAEIRELEQPGMIFTPEFIKNALEKFSLWQNPLDDICKKAARIKVKEIMGSPGHGELIPETASLNEAIHQLVLGSHQSLLVTSGEKITGILRLSDVFVTISQLIKACAL